MSSEQFNQAFTMHGSADGFTALNSLSTFGSFLLGLSILPFFYNV